MLGRKHSEETKRKQSESHRKRYEMKKMREDNDEKYI